MTNNYIVFNQEVSVGYLHAIRTSDTTLVHKLHCHDNIYEIIMLISGNLEFHVEGSVYKPNKYDIIIVRPNELHKLIQFDNEPYERYTLHISSDFFVRNNCKKFESIFLNRKLGTNNLIPATIVKEKMRDNFYRIEEYFEKGENLVLNSSVIEFLYNLNCSNKEALEPKIKNERINEIILFINENLKENISLELLSEKFFIDKFYLCKAFKKNTSFTVNQYLTYKRVLLAKELYDNGMSLTDASLNAGFNTYSNFYKSHLKYIGTSPSHSLSKS